MQDSNKEDEGRGGDRSPRTRVSIRPSDELTCSEGQVEAVLSEGESTEQESIRPPKRTDQKRSTRNKPQADAPDRKRN